MIDLARFSSTPKCNEFVELSAKIADLKPAIARAASAWDHFGLKIAEIDLSGIILGSLWT